MVHEAMVLESSGRDLAAVELGSWLRLSVLLALVANLVVPWGIATGDRAGGARGRCARRRRQDGGVGVLLGTAEVFMAKLRLFRVPELLTGSFVLAFLAVTGSYVIAR